MGYDLLLFKPRARSKLAPGLACLLLSEALPAPGLAKFPAKKVAAALRARFGADFESELQAYLDDAHLSVTLAFGDRLEESLEALHEIAQAHHLTCYDPQLVEPTTDDLERFAALKAAARSDAQSETVVALQHEAEAGSPSAMNDLATCYAFGEGVAQDDANAVCWYRKAASAGFRPALLNLAECYRRGEGVVQDGAEATRLFIEAGDAGLVQAVLSLAEYTRTGAGVPRDADQARLLYERALSQDRCVAAFELGRMYETGDGVAQSYDKAEEYFLLARQNRHPEAYRALKRIGRVPPD